MVGGNRVDTIIITNSLPHLWKHFAAAAAAVAIECLTFVKNKQNVKILVSLYVCTFIGYSTLHQPLFIWTEEGGAFVHVPWKESFWTGLWWTVVVAEDMGRGSVRFYLGYEKDIRNLFLDLSVGRPNYNDTTNPDGDKIVSR